MYFKIYVPQIKNRNVSDQTSRTTSCPYPRMIFTLDSSLLWLHPALWGVNVKSIVTVNEGRVFNPEVTV